MSTTRRLFSVELEMLCRAPGVRRIAVENFLSSVDFSMPLHFHLANLKMDSKLYGWKDATILAIYCGLKKMYGEWEEDK